MKRNLLPGFGQSPALRSTVGRVVPGFQQGWDEKQRKDAAGADSESERLKKGGKKTLRLTPGRDDQMGEINVRRAGASAGSRDTLGGGQ